MKIYKLIIFIIVLVLAIVFNIYYFKYSWFIFTGLFLTLWLTYAFFSNFIIKLYKNKRGIPQEKYAYAFPDAMAKIMKKVDIRTQLESGLLSMFFILIGMIFLDIYMIFFMNFDWWFKGLILFNSFWGAAFLLTSLVGQYQSYVTYMQTVESLNSNDLLDTTLQLNINNMKGG
jgi:hypothetical protein